MAKSDFTPEKAPSYQSSISTSAPKTPSDGYLHGAAFIRAVIALNFANAVAFVDLLGISALLPFISEHFNGNPKMNLAAPLQIIGAVIGQCILGYLSDFYGRRNMLLVASAILAFSALGCALCVYTIHAPFFVVLSSLSGTGIGSISNLVNIAQNDISPEDRRLKYQGVQGSGVAIGSTIGVMGGAAIAVYAKWQYFYYMVAGLAFLVFLAIYFCVPSNVQGRSKVKNFDYLGIITLTGAIVCVVLLLCVHEKFNVTELSILGAGAAICSIAFACTGYCNPTGARQILPFKLWRNRTVAAIFIQNMLFGSTYYTFIYYTPLALKTVRGIPLLRASAMMIPYFASHGICSTISANVVRRLQRRGGRSYSLVFFFGFTMWTIGQVLLGIDSTEQWADGWLVILPATIVGMGTGCVFQNSVMAIQKQVPKELKAVAISGRNTLRYGGGVIGVAMTSAIIQGVLSRTLPAHLAYIVHAAVAEISVDKLSPEDLMVVRDAYAGSIRIVNLVSAGMAALCAILVLLIQDGAEKEEDMEMRGIKPKESSGYSTPRG